MEFLAGFLGALVGMAAGGLSAFLTSRAQMRRELEYAYDRDLRARRVEASSAAAAQQLPENAPDQPTRFGLP
jgi:hypothetical protein